MTLKQKINAAIKNWPEDAESKHKLNAGQRREALKTIAKKIRDEKTFYIFLIKYAFTMKPKRAKAKTRMGAKGAYKARSASASKRGKR